MKRYAGVTWKNPMDTFLIDKNCIVRFFKILRRTKTILCLYMKFCENVHQKLGMGCERMSVNRNWLHQQVMLPTANVFSK